MTPTASYGIMPATGDCAQCGRTIVIERDDTCSKCSEGQADGSGDVALTDGGTQAQLAGDLREGQDEYNTPLEWVAPVSSAVGGFDLDPCASSTSSLADHNIRETGGLDEDWSKYDTVWCNHPYADPGPWVRKAAESDCETIVTLSKGDPSTDWFHDYLTQAELLCFPSERIKFIGEDNSAKFPNVYGVFGEVPEDLHLWFESIGWTVEP